MEGRLPELPATGPRRRLSEGPREPTDQGRPITHQCLLYPLLDRDPSRESYRDGACARLTASDVQWFWELYQGPRAARGDQPSEATPLEAAPLRASDDVLAGAAPATVVTAGFDPLRDEGLASVERLRGGGIDVTHRHDPDQPHGFLSLTRGVDAAAAGMDPVADELRTALR